MRRPLNDLQRMDFTQSVISFLATFVSLHLAFAWKELSSFNAENPHRHDYECQLNLLGFVVLRNEVRLRFRNQLICHFSQ